MTAPMEIVKNCVFCGKPNLILIQSDEDWTAYWEWKDGAFIQSAFSHWSPGKREALISGSHEKCFDELKPDCNIEGHDWPSDLTPEAICGECGLVYAQWSVDA